MTHFNRQGTLYAAMVVIVAMFTVLFTVTTISSASSSGTTFTTASTIHTVKQDQSIANAASGSNPANVLAIAPTATAVAPEIRAQADAMETVLVNVFQRADPAVVNIEVSVDNSDDVEFTGSGFMVDMDGHIVTNNHVVDGAKSISVTFYDGYTATAKLVGTDDFSDLAVIKVTVPADHLVPLTFADSDKLHVGQRVIAIGNPFGLLSSMTTGIVSATGRTLNSKNLKYRNPSIIQTDAQINPGNSGGPLLNMDGQVVGINSAISTDSGTFQGVGFAVPSNTVKRVVPQLIASGKAEYAWLGITTGSGSGGITVAALAEPLNLPVSAGILVSEVIPGSPAETAGLRGGNATQVIKGVRVTTGGDIITEVNGIPLRDMDQLLAFLVANAAPGDKITLTVVRGKNTIQVDVVLKVRPPGQS